MRPVDEADLDVVADRALGQLGEGAELVERVGAGGGVLAFHTVYYDSNSGIVKGPARGNLSERNLGPIVASVLLASAKEKNDKNNNVGPPNKASECQETNAVANGVTFAVQSSGVTNVVLWIWRTARPLLPG